jgi:hypothetical protein
MSIELTPRMKPIVTRNRFYFKKSDNSFLKTTDTKNNTLYQMVMTSRVHSTAATQTDIPQPIYQEFRPWEA